MTTDVSAMGLKSFSTDGGVFLGMGQMTADFQIAGIWCDNSDLLNKEQNTSDSSLLQFDTDWIIESHEKREL